MKQKKCLYEKCFIKNEIGLSNEESFIKYIDKKAFIEWWFKNGDQGKDFYAVKYYNTNDQEERLFYPDWILKLQNGKICVYLTLNLGGPQIQKEERKL